MGIDINTTWHLCCYLFNYSGLSVKRFACFRIINVSHPDELFCDKQNFVRYVELTLHTAFHGLVWLFKPSFASYASKVTYNLCCLEDPNI